LAESKQHSIGLVVVAIAVGAALLLAGCRPTTTPVAPTNGMPGTAERATLRVLVIDDPDGAAILEEHWRARASDEELIVRTAASRDLADARRLSADVVIYPARFMGELVERELIQPLPAHVLQSSGSDDSAHMAIALDQLLPTVRQCEASWGRTPYAVTLGSPQFVLLYRPDVFARLNLAPPQTWAELEAAAEQLADRDALGELAPAEDRPWHALLEPTADGWAGATLLARSASSLRSEQQLYTLFDIDDMSARIASPAMVEAAAAMARTAALSQVDSLKRLTPGEVRRAFFAGEAAMAITWPSAAEAGDTRVSVAFAELPGSDRLYSFQDERWIDKPEGADRRASLCAIAGSMASVTREARRSRAAFQFLAWLQSDDAAPVLGPASDQTTLFTFEHLAQPQVWTGESASGAAAAQYAAVAESAFTRPVWTAAVRVPGVDAYLAALDAAVVKTLENPDQAQAALDEAARQWNAITERYDLNRHRRAYQRSLGSDY
jgi:multiple sugar transport system substrate-binding protein